MHASTCIDASTLAARSASSGIGSTTPCGYCGADPTTSAVLPFTCAAIASTSARKSSSTGTVWTRTPKSWPALWNAACALAATTISGAVDAALRSRPLARRLHRHEDALGPARRHESGHARGAVEELRARGDDLGLDLAETRERLRVQRVLVQEHDRGGFRDVVHLLPAVEHEPERAAFLPARVTRRASRRAPRGSRRRSFRARGGPRPGTVRGFSPSRGELSCAARSTPRPARAGLHEEALGLRGERVAVEDLARAT